MVVAEAPIEEKVVRTTATFNKLLDAYLSGKRNLWVEGGTWSSKTYSFMQLLVFILEGWKSEELLCTVSSETLPHLRIGAMRDFRSIMGNDLLEARWNESKLTYTWPNGCMMEFIGADRQSKFQGGRRDILFCNEVNNINQAAFRQASMRTRMFIGADWNPVSEFWFHDENLDTKGRLIDTHNNVYLRRLTYLDALEVLPDSVRAEIESYKEKDPNWWRVYGLGLVGKLQGLVYPNFEQIDELPDGDVFYGLDYGFSGDPTALVRCVIVGENLYSQEVLYKTGLTNDDIARELNKLQVDTLSPIYADANEPKSAEEIRRLGFNIIAVDKAYFRKNYRIQKVNQYYQFWTKDSLNGIKEQRNYRYIEDRQRPGQFTDNTTHEWSHLMSAREFAAVSRTGVGKRAHKGRRY